MPTQLRIAGNPESCRWILDEIVFGREHGGAGTELGMEALDLAEPDRNDARRADDQGAFADRPRGEQGQDLDGLAEAHLVGQQRMRAEFAEPAEPGYALRLIRTQVGGQIIGRRRLVEQLILPGLEVVVEFEGADRRMIEEREQQVTRHFAVLRAPVLGEVGDGGVIGHDTLTGEDDRTAARLEQELLFVGEQAVSAGLEPPVQFEGLPVRGRFGFRVDGDLQLLVAEDIEGVFTDQFEALAPFGQVFPHETFDPTDVVDRPGARGLAVGEAGPMGHGIEPEQGLTLLVGKFIARDRAGSEAIPSVPSPTGPAGGDLQPVGGKFEGHLQLERSPGVGILALRLFRGLGGGRHGGLIDRRQLIGQQLLDFIDRGHGEGRSVLLFGQRSAPVEFAVDDLDDGSDRLLLGAGDGLGALGLEFDLSDQSFGIEPATFGEVGGLEGVFPVFRHGRKPPLQGFRGVGAVGRTRGRHRRWLITP